MLPAGAALGPRAVYLLRCALLAALYYPAARLGLRYASIGESISLIWPPTGLALAAITLLGYRYWPAIALGAFLANAATAIPDAAAAAIAAGNTLEALAGAWLLRRTVGPRPQLDDARHVWSLVLVAVPPAAAVSAVIGVTALFAAGELAGRTFPAALGTWWVGNVLGALVVAPVVFTWAVPPRTRENPRAILEVALLCLGTAVAAELGLGPSFARVAGVEYPYLLFPFVIWAAMRFGPRGASLMTLTVAGVTVWHAVQGVGPFAARGAVPTLAACALYVATVAITGLVLAAAVVRERQSATSALRRSEARLRLALESARMGIWFWSVEHNSVSWDPNLRALYGLGPRDEVRTYEDFLARVHPDDREFVAETVRRAAEGRGDLDYEFRIVLPDGRVRWVADRGEVGRDEQGRVLYMTGVCMDVTERRVTEERLRQAHRMESVGRLAGGVAHETNNQMSVVLGSASFILRRSDVPEAVRMDVEQIRRAAERTAAVTAQLLAFSRRQILRPAVLDLNAVVKGWEPVLRRVMGEDCAVLLRLSPDVGRVKADPGQLEQVLLNLALNARDAMPRGGTLTVETFTAELTPAYARGKPGVAVRPGTYAVLAASDTGHGMDAATLSHVFEPFFTTKGPGHGTGLGLSVVYGIVKQSNGYVWAYSEPGRGATFKIYLPLTSEPATAEPAGPPVERVPTGELVLVVEDDESVRRVARRALEEAGYQVLEAEDGRRALEVLAGAAARINLLLTDVVMPGMSGRELAERAAELVPGLPVVFTSGYTDSDIVRRGLVESNAVFIQKPFTPEAVVRTVRETLRAWPVVPA